MVNAVTVGVPLRILHLAGEYPPWRIGGIATYLENLVHQQRQRHEIGVVVLRGAEYREDMSCADGPMRVEVIDLDVTQIGDRPVLDRTTCEALVPDTGLLAERWDVLHVHDWYGALPALAMLGRGAHAMVTTAHLPLRYGFTYANHPVPLRWKSRLETLAFRLARRVMAPSHHVAVLLEREYDVPEAKLRVVHNGVDLELFRPTGTRASVPTVIAVSRLSEQKGLDLLLRAFARVRAVVPNACLVVVGEGPARVTVAADVACLGLSEAVALPGYIAHRELPALYASAHAFVTTSVYEPFGLTTLEAMACGTPVIVSGLGGAPEIVRDGKDGFVCWPHDSGAVAAALTEILLTGEADAELGRRARRRAEAFGWERTADAVEACYREALGAME
jgi:glycosyltransferase involved in cell wall biosynthesis